MIAPNLAPWIMPVSVVENITPKVLMDEIVARFEGDMMYFPESKQFARYQDGIWREISDEEMTKFILEFLDSIFNAIPHEQRSKIGRFYTKTHLLGFLHTLKSRLLSKVPYSQFEPPENVLPFKNCKVVFHTDGTTTIEDLKQSDYITKYFDFDFTENSKEPSAWNEFLNEIFLEDRQLITFVMNATGYSLLPWNLEVLFVCHGNGNNGKSTFLNTLNSILKPFSATIDAETTLNSSFSKGPREDVARLRGVRFVSCSELPNKAVLDEKLIKNLTGRDTIAARFLYQGTFEFNFFGKIWISTKFCLTFLVI